MSLIQSNSVKGDYLYFNEDDHTYLLNSKLVPGVTTINRAYPMSPHLVTWMVKQGCWDVVTRLKEYPEQVNRLPDYLLDEVVKKAGQAGKRKAKEAADIGTIIHDYCEQWEKSQTISDELLAKIDASPEREKLDNCLTNFKDWYKQNEDKIEAHEEIIGHAKLGYAGKFDSLRRRGDKLILSDYKTSSGIHTEYLIQLGAYALALKEWKGITVDGVEVVRFGKFDGKFEVKTIMRKSHIKEFQEQFVRNLETHKFRMKWE